MGIISTLIVLAAVSFALNKIMEKRKSTTDSLSNFDIKVGKIIVIIGWLDLFFFLFCLAGCIYANQLTTSLILIFGGLALLGFILAFADKLWVINVNGDLITITLLFFIKKQHNISNIERCEKNNQQQAITVFFKDGKKMKIDLMCNNLKNWIKRMQAESIPVEGFTEEELSKILNKDEKNDNINQVPNQNMNMNQNMNQVPNQNMNMNQNMNQVPNQNSNNQNNF